MTIMNTTTSSIGAEKDKTLTNRGLSIGPAMIDDNFGRN